MIYFVHTLFNTYGDNMGESEIEKYLVKKCNANDIFIMKVVPTVMNGLPDRLLLYKGFSIFVELKEPGAKPRKAQWNIIKTLNNYSNALYLDSTELIDKLIALLISGKYKSHNTLHKLLLENFEKQMINENKDFIKWKL